MSPGGVSSRLWGADVDPPAGIDIGPVEQHEWERPGATSMEAASWAVRCWLSPSPSPSRRRSR